jgi:glycosyltransferase involved in cell wall biosynthesis
VAQDPTGAEDPPLKVLVVSPRTPAAAGKGDQLRALQLTRALAARHTVEVLTTAAGARVPGAEAEVASVARLLVQRVTPAARLAGAVGALAQGRPLQVGWMTPPRAWRTVRRRADEADVVLALTVRALRGPLPVPVILDHVDALSLNMRRRAGGPEPAPLRLAARAEAALLRRWERRLARWVAVQAAISPVDARELPAPPEVHVLPNSVELPAAMPGEGQRDIDVVFTGNMAYPPNADAARWLSEAIAPALWRRRPEASVWVVGRAARRLALDPRIEVRADVEDVGDYLRRARLALAPLRIGTGAPNKVLEAMAAGATVVATPAAVAPFGFPPGALATADGADGLAAVADRLLADDHERRRIAEHARALVVAYGAAAQRERIEGIVRQAAGARDRTADQGGSGLPLPSGAGPRPGSAMSRIRRMLSRSSTQSAAR